MRDTFYVPGSKKATKLWRSMPGSRQASKQTDRHLRRIYRHPADEADVIFLYWRQRLR